jgi:multimeric flavodoxin WrbA
MKILAIVGTAKRKGSVAQLSQQILEGAKVNNHQVELLNLFDYKIMDCIGCWRCVEKEKCVLKDDFEIIFDKVREADVIIIASPVYWGDVTSKMKAFFDRHTGYAMVKPKDAPEFHRLSFMNKIKTMKEVTKKFGPYEELQGKRYIIVTASTVPKIPGYLTKDLLNTIRTMKIYINKMKGKRVGKIIYADSLFQLNPNKKEKLMKKAFNLGKSL